MPARTGRLAEARAEARTIRIALGGEIRQARISAGASLADAGGRVDMSHAQLGRIERGLLATVSVDQLSRACVAVGLRLVVRAVPGAGPAVDRAQLALLDRFRGLLPTGIRLDTEVPLPNPGDPRAWDGFFMLAQKPIAVEAETRLRDLQALDRRCRLKMRDSGVERVVLVVSDTAHNREMLDLYRDGLRATFPLDGRQIRRALRESCVPVASGIVVL